MNTKVVLHYDGSGYSGWQDQQGRNNVLTVEEIVSKVISTLNKEETTITASGRTDKGVHALHQVIHFDNVNDIPNDRLKFALNNALPKDIEVVSCESVSDDFHARFSATSKEYHYYLNVGPYDMFKRHYETTWNTDLNLEKMREVAEYFVGKHDFTAFNTTPKEVKSNQVITILKFDLEEVDNHIIFKIEGTSFLRHMVRMLVGTIVFVGCGRLSFEEVKNLLDYNKGRRAPYNIEANGLYLVDVKYNHDDINE